jgi:hypothetical protein
MRRQRGQEAGESDWDMTEQNAVEKWFYRLELDS